MSARLRDAGPLAVAAFVVASTLTLALAVFPAIELVRAAAGGTPSGQGLEHPLLAFVTSVAWALGAATIGALLAWPASRAFRGSRGASLAALFVLLPLALPPWLLYAAMWMSAGPGTAIGDWSERHDLVAWLRLAILSLALVAWCAALSFAVLSATGPRALSADERLLALDGAPWIARVRAMLARDARSIAVAVFASCAFLVCETTVYDLAQVATFGFELRTLDALGAAPREVAVAAWPAVALALAAGACMPRAACAVGDASLRARGASAPPSLELTPLELPSPARIRLPAMVLVAAALPGAAVLALLIRIDGSIPRVGDFLPLHGRALLVTCSAAACVAAVTALLAAALRVLLDARRSPAAAGSARAMAFLLVAAGCAPATLTALSMEAAYNRPALASIYDSPVILVLALAARAAPLAAISALVFAARESASAPRLRAIDGVSWLSAWRGLRRELAVVSVAAGTLAFAWSLGELTASGRVVPPGVPWIATDILNAIHYQRPDTVVLATAALALAAFPAVVALLRATRRLQGQLALLALAAAVMILPGCGGGGADASAPEPEDRVMQALVAASPAVKDPLAVAQEFAGAGRGRGQFYGPRVLAIDRRSGDSYVIDKDARVQAFSPDGTVRAEWRLPKWDRGKPTGASVAPDGTLVVADTHEHRLVAYSPTGELLWTLGEYGTGPGQFIYPTDIVFLADGRILVSEYGGNDRIQAFGADRRVMHQFGRSGTGPGEFLRPQAMAYDAERDELYVVDAGNHRVQVFTSDGELRRTLGKAGMGAGELNYPFGIVLLIGGRATDALGQAGDGDQSAARRTIVLAEHGNHRVQALDGQTGESLAIAGGIGRETGRLKYPWAVEPAGVATDGSQRFGLCDHGNSRIVFFTLPAGH